MLRLTGGAAALALLGKGGRAAASPRRRPNIVMIVADDHRHSAIGALGEAAVRSPVLDQLVAGGAAFTCAHDMGGKNAAVCVPTRASLLTGCNTFRALSRPRDNEIAPDRVTISEHFQKAGYDTFITGKWHNDHGSLMRSFADGRGIMCRGMTHDQWHVPVQDYDPAGVYDESRIYHASGFSTDFFCDHAVDYIGRHRGDRPFFLYAAFTSPHDPRTPPAEFADLYTPERIPVSPNHLEEHPFDNGALHIRDEELAPFPRTPERMQREIAGYYGMISNIDTGVGRILEAIERSGQADNTIVIYTADHGLAVGRHGLLGKQNLYEHSVRVPLILRGPGVPAGLRSDALAYAWDLFPTLCDLAGIPTPDGLDARSLSPILLGRRTAHRDSVHAYYLDFQRMVKEERWKLIEYRVNDARHTQLFDLASDPWEMRNLADDPDQNGTIRRLRENLIAWQRANGDDGSFPLSI